jgi:hypothetical protein
VLVRRFLDFDLRTAGAAAGAPPDVDAGAAAALAMG